MKALIFFIFLFLCTNGYPIKKQNKERKEKSKINEKESEDNKANPRISSVGSNLFGALRNTCFSPDEVILLRARREFEMMIPRNLPQDLLDDKAVEDIMRYFYSGLWQLQRIDDNKARRTMEKAFYDTLGGFLAHYLVPVVKFSYYADKVGLRTVRNVLELDKKCRRFLNTSGNGWRKPIKDPIAEFSAVKIEPLKFVDNRGLSDEEKKYCTDLDLSTAQVGTEIIDDGLIVALPKLELEDPDGFLGNVWFPFSRKRTYNLRLSRSAFIFAKYYRSVSSCYRQKNLKKRSFDKKFRQWIFENVKCHLGDELFYPGLGGILNIYEDLKEVSSHEKRNADETIYQQTNNERVDNVLLMTEKSAEHVNNNKNPDFSQRAMDNERNNFENSQSIDNQIVSLNETLSNYEGNYLENSKSIVNQILSLNETLANNEFGCGTRVYPTFKTVQSNTEMPITEIPITDCPIFTKDFKTTEATKVSTIFKNTIKKIKPKTKTGNDYKSVKKISSPKTNNKIQDTSNTKKMENESQKRHWYIGRIVFAVMLIVLLFWICILCYRKCDNKKNKYIAMSQEDMSSKKKPKEVSQKDMSSKKKPKEVSQKDMSSKKKPKEVKYTEPLRSPHSASTRPKSLSEKSEKQTPLSRTTVENAYVGCCIRRTETNGKPSKASHAKETKETQNSHTSEKHGCCIFRKKTLKKPIKASRAKKTKETQDIHTSEESEKHSKKAHKKHSKKTKKAYKEDESTDCTTKSLQKDSYKKSPEMIEKKAEKAVKKAEKSIDKDLKKNEKEAKKTVKKAEETDETSDKQFSKEKYKRYPPSSSEQRDSQRSRSRSKSRPRPKLRKRTKSSSQSR